MTTWIREHFDNAEHAKTTISAGAVIAAAVSLVLILTWAMAR